MFQIGKEIILSTCVNITISKLLNKKGTKNCGGEGRVQKIIQILKIAL